jgi:hypothetical protein
MDGTGAPLNWSGVLFFFLFFFFCALPLAWFVVVVVQCRHSLSRIGIRKPWSWSSLRMTTVPFSRARLLFMLYCIPRAFFFVWVKYKIIQKTNTHTSFLGFQKNEGEKTKRKKGLR